MDGLLDKEKQYPNLVRFVVPSGSKSPMLVWCRNHGIKQNPSKSLFPLPWL